MTTGRFPLVGNRMHMLLETALEQVCASIAFHMGKPSDELRGAIRAQIRVALFCARVLGKISNNGRHLPTIETDHL